MKFQSTLWFSSMAGCYGIVMGEDEVTGEYKAYIGAAGGLDEEEDIEKISTWGAPVAPSQAAALFLHFKTEHKG